MKIALKYQRSKRSLYSMWKFRELKIYNDKDIYIAKIKQGGKIIKEIPQNTNYIYGKMDWMKTKKLMIQDISDGEVINIIALEAQLYLLNDILTLPIQLNTKRSVQNNKDEEKTKTSEHNFNKGTVKNHPQKYYSEEYNSKKNSTSESKDSAIEIFLWISLFVAAPPFAFLLWIISKGRDR